MGKTQIRVAVGLMILVASGGARAGTAGDEEALLRRGVDLRKAGDDLGAWREFKKAYDLTHSPRAAGQMGTAEHALGRWEDADVHVTEALRAKTDPWVMKNRLALEKSSDMIKAHLARVELVGEPVGAEAFVNGRAVGRLPVTEPVGVSAGEVDIEVRAPGYVRNSRKIVLSGGQYQKLVFRLERETSAVGAATPGAQEEPIARPPPPIVGQPADAVPPSRTGSSLRASAKWGALGLAAAALGTGIAATVIHGRNVDEFENLNGRGCYDDNGVARDRSGAAVRECQPALDAYRRARTWQIVGFVGAGVFAATWLVLTLTEPRGSGGEVSMSRWSCAPALTAVGGSCVLRF